MMLSKKNIDESSSIQVMLDNPSAIKRPVLESGRTLLVGFKEDEYKEATINSFLPQRRGDAEKNIITCYQRRRRY